MFTTTRHALGIRIALTADPSTYVALDVRSTGGSDLWTGYAESCGAAMRVFCGKSWRGEKGAVRAAEKWLRERAARAIENAQPLPACERPEAPAWLVGVDAALEDGAEVVEVCGDMVRKVR